MGFITTASVAEGDSRESGLQRLVETGWLLYAATTARPWPGEAGVDFVSLCLATGHIRTMLEGQPRTLDEMPVAQIDTRLTNSGERPIAPPLTANLAVRSKGTDIYGSGFVVTPEERARLLASSPRNEERIRPYLRGEDVTDDPLQAPADYVIDFSGLDLTEARAWPDLLTVVEEKVKPSRDAMRDTPINRRMKQLWWRYWAERTAFYADFAAFGSCYVISQTTKHLVLSRQVPGLIFSQRIFAFMVGVSGFAVLQSRAHECWARLLSASRGDRISYSTSDCFDNFPFPKPDPRTVIAALEDIGQRLYGFRAKYMADENVGLTVTYNRLKAPGCDDARIHELRRLHEEMDRKVLHAYGEGDPDGRWLEVDVPPFCLMNDNDMKKLASFEDAVIARLFVLNARRVEEERIRGLGANAGKKKGPAKKAPAAAVGERKPRTRKKKADEQLVLGSDDDG